MLGTWLVLVRVGVTATCTRDPGATSSSLIVMMGWSRWWCTATCSNNMELPGKLGINDDAFVNSTEPSLTLNHVIIFGSFED